MRSEITYPFLNVNGQTAQSASTCRHQRAEMTPLNKPKSYGRMSFSTLKTTQP